MKRYPSPDPRPYRRSRNGEIVGAAIGFALGAAAVAIIAAATIRLVAWIV